MNNINNSKSLVYVHGGYRNLKSFQIAQLVYDVTVRFCNRYIEKRSRTHDQMVQAARSGVQNIAEGSQASGTSKKTELKLKEHQKVHKLSFKDENSPQVHDKRGYSGPGKLGEFVVVLRK